MHNHLLNNCRFNLENITLKDREKLELILLCYNIGWGFYESTKLIDKSTLEKSKYIWVKDSIIWQSRNDYEPFNYLPILDVENILLNY